VAARKRRVTYPKPRTATAPRPAFGGESSPGRPTLVSIDLAAQAGRGGLAVGDRVRILGTGLYAGETAAIEGFANGAVPAALVRTEAGRTRRVRTIDLEPIGGQG
jgi:hypothetical protein